MLNRKIASGSERLYQFTDYRLNKMWLDGEIDKCPKCRKYHDKNSDETFMYNLSLCDRCKGTQEILDDWFGGKVKSSENH